jgi:hypothetical protein
MASPDAIRRALLVLLGRAEKYTGKSGDLPLSSDIPTGGGTLPIPQKQVGPGPSPYDSLREMEAMGLSQRNQQNQFQKALMESGGKKFDRTDKKSVFDEAPIDDEKLSREAIEEVIGPRDRVRKQKRIKPGEETMDYEASAEQLDNLSGEFEKGQIGKIQDELDTDIFLQTLSPELQKLAARDILIPKSIRLKEIDEAALDLFGGPNKAGLIPETQGALSGKDISRKQDFTIKTTPPKRSKGELAQVGQSSAQLHKFRILASQVTDAAREANKIKPNMDKVHRIISKMPEEVKAKLRPAFENDTLDEALADLMQQLVRRMTQ